MDSPVKRVSSVHSNFARAKLASTRQSTQRETSFVISGAICNCCKRVRREHCRMSWFKKEPKSYEIQGHVLKCTLCGHDEFHRREAQLNTTAMTFLNLDWANASAQCFVCDKCGKIEWFLPK
jgi:hypothetical protein